ncbi:hypothetical protein BDEG_23624 [Batrachochytrium dendrobatidis JEL423]|nr:hypothetical protein BDEG_23624 [Batrachochytrium dendrobatidis JEL423]
MIRLFVLAFIAVSVSALRFDLLATSGQGTRKCIDQYVHKNTLVSGIVDVPARDSQRVDAEIIDDTVNQSKHWSRPNIVGEHKFSFTVHEDAYLRFCFTSTLPNDVAPGPDVKRTVFLRLDMGAEAKQYVAEMEVGKLEPIEIELRRLEEMAREIINDFLFLEDQGNSMHNVNESTLDRVSGLSTFTILLLIVVGGWQVWYMHSFFKAKKLI